MAKSNDKVEFPVPEDWDNTLVKLYSKYLELSEGFFTDAGAEEDIVDDPEEWDSKKDSGWWK